MKDTELVFDPATYVAGVPFDALARLRNQHPIVWVEETAVLGWQAGPGFWLVLRHAAVETVLKSPQLFSSHRGATQIRDPSTPQALSYVQKMMLNMDPPEHARLRRLLSRSLTPKAVATLEDRIHHHAKTIAGRTFTKNHGETDFAKDVAADLPLLTLADVLGVPGQDRWLLFDWSNRVIGYQDPDYATSAEFDPETATPMARQAHQLRPHPDADGRMPDPRTRDGMPDLYTYAHLLAEHKRRNPGPDVMSILLSQDEHISTEEFENMFWLFAVAGNETLRNGLPGACIALLEHPEAQHQLRTHPELLKTAVDEMLRWWTPVMTFRRTATADCELAGQRIRANDKVVVSFTSANRDETVFADPDRFDIHRTPNPHLVFGHGPHFCLGAHLARTQMRALFAEVLSRTTSLSYADSPSYLRSNFQRGVKSLPVAWAFLLPNVLCCFHRPAVCSPVRRCTPVRRGGFGARFAEGNMAAMSITTLTAEPVRHALVVPGDCTCGTCMPTWARRRGKSRKYSEPVTLEFALGQESTAARPGMVEKHREFLAAMTEHAGRLLDESADYEIGDPEIGLSILEFSGELATVIQPDLFGNELPSDLIAACEKTITTATYVTAELMAGVIDGIRELSAMLQSGSAIPYPR